MKTQKIRKRKFIVGRTYLIKMEWGSDGYLASYYVKVGKITDDAVWGKFKLTGDKEWIGDLGDDTGKFISSKIRYSRVLPK